jgi:hypothetical protein
VSELAEFNTTCYPRTTFVNHSEFVAFGCRGSSDKQSFAGFNLKGEEMWQQNFFDTQILPTFAFAPAAGRFALGRTIVSSAGDSTMPFSPGVANSQEVRVYQMYSGKQLLRIECTPIIRAGQNFALSPDGMQLAVVRETMLRHPATKTDDAYTSRTAAVEIYALPALSNKDQVAVKEAQGFAPEDTGARIDLALQRQSGPPPSDAQAANAMTGSTAAVPGSASAPGSPEPALPALPVEESLPAAEQSAPAEASAAGDPVDTAPRKPPTLYGPGEAPAGKSPR